MDQQQLINSLEEKVNLLAERMEALRAENTRLLREKNELEANLSQERGTLATLKDKLKSTQRALDKQRGGASEDTAELRARIEASLKEVDSCIEWLQNG